MRVVAPAGGEVVGDSADRRVEILSDHDSLHATWSRFGPGREGADLHVHRAHTDLFYVLDGELTVRLGVEDETVAVPAGTLVRVPPLVVHGFRNGSDREVRYLNLHAPGMRFADYMRALRDRRPFSYDQHPPPADGARPAGDAVVGGGEVVVDRPGLRVAVLADAEAIRVAEVHADPGEDAPPPSRPGRLRSLYVLAGALSVGGTRAEAGAWAQLAPGEAETLAVAGGVPARFLAIETPA